MLKKAMKKMNQNFQNEIEKQKTIISQKNKLNQDLENQIENLKHLKDDFTKNESKEKLELKVKLDEQIKINKQLQIEIDKAMSSSHTEEIVKYKKVIKNKDEQLSKIFQRCQDLSQTIEILNKQLDESPVADPKLIKVFQYLREVNSKLIENHKFDSLPVLNTIFNLMHLPVIK